MKRAIWVGALMLPAPAMAQTGPDMPWIWPAPALYGMESTACGKDSPNLAMTAAIATALCPDLAPARRQVIGRSFAASVERHFPHVETAFGSHLPKGASAAMRLRGTLVASLRITRAQIAVVPKPGGVDAYMPVTLTMDITNVANGEVVFTRSLPHAAQGIFQASDVEARLAEQLPGQLDSQIEELVTKAAGEFRPYAQSAGVIGDVPTLDGRGYVVDKGRTSGLRTGDDLGDGHIVLAGADYAVMRSDLGTPRKGDVLTRTALAPADMLARPGLLVAVDQVPEGYAQAYVGQVFQDAVGAAGRFAPVPVNPSFSALRGLALAEARAPEEERALPDYVALLNIVSLPDAHFPSNVPGAMIDRYEAHAYVTLVDASGRVLGAWQGDGRIEDSTVDGMRFSPVTRRDSALRNALTDVSRKMASFRPQPAVAAVSLQQQKIIIADPAGAVPLGLTLPVMREAGRFHEIKGPVMVPAGEVTGQEAVGASVAAVDAGVRPLALHGGEVVALESGGVSAATRQVVAQCGEAAPQFEDRGALPVAMWQAAAENVLASRMPAPVRLARLPEVLAPYAPSFAGWSRFRAAKARPVDVCFVPVVAVKPLVGGAYDLTVGYTLHRAGAKIASSGQHTVMTPTRLPPGVPDADRAAVLQADLAAQIQPLALTAAAGLRAGS